MDDQGKCDYCGVVFVYGIFHDGQGESVYAYCDQCGELAILDRWRLLSMLPSNIGRPTNTDFERLVQPCECGGRFTIDAGPRCPSCKAPIADQRMAGWLRKNVPGLASKAMADRKAWSGTYAIAINKSYIRDNFR